MDQTIVTQELVYSSLAGDPELGEIVDMFVEEMPGRIAAILEQLNAANWEGLQRTAHQLKGAAGSYGFDMITPCAGKLESAVRVSEPEERIRAAVDELVNLCSRTRCGVPAK